MDDESKIEPKLMKEACPQNPVDWNTGENEGTGGGKRERGNFFSVCLCFTHCWLVSIQMPTPPMDTTCITCGQISLY